MKERWLGRYDCVLHKEENFTFLQSKCLGNRDSFMADSIGQVQWESPFQKDNAERGRDTQRPHWCSPFYCLSLCLCFCFFLSLSPSPLLYIYNVLNYIFTYSYHYRQIRKKCSTSKAPFGIQNNNSCNQKKI